MKALIATTIANFNQHLKEKAQASGEIRNTEQQIAKRREYLLKLGKGSFYKIEFNYFGSYLLDFRSEQSARQFMDKLGFHRDTIKKVSLQKCKDGGFCTKGKEVKQLGNTFYRLFVVFDRIL